MRCTSIRRTIFLVFAEMEAGNWEELDFLLKAAGLTAEQVMGLDNEFSDDEGPIPSPKTFKENLKLHVMGEELQIPYPDMSVYEVYGTKDMKEELYTPPPFMDMERFLRPEPIPPETVAEVQRLTAYFEGNGKKSGESSLDEVSVQTEIVTPHLCSKAGPSEVPSGELQLSGKPKKRRRASSSDEDRSSSTPGLEVEEMCDADPPAAIVIPSSSNSSTDTLMEDTPVIDLTQQ